jgi:hypothetical protein
MAFKMPFGVTLVRERFRLTRFFWSTCFRAVNAVLNENESTVSPPAADFFGDRRGGLNKLDPSIDPGFVVASFSTPLGDDCPVAVEQSNNDNGVTASFMGIVILLGDWANRPASALAAGVALLVGKVGDE